MNAELKSYDTLLCRQVFRQALTIVGIVLLSRLTKNWAVAGLALYGILNALKQRPGPTLIDTNISRPLPASPRWR